MLKFKIRCTWFETNYSSNTCQSNENVVVVVRVFMKKKE